MAIGERPGRWENKYGRVFIGDAGQELDETYLPLAGLCRPDLYVTNAVKCWAENNRTPSAKEVATCSKHFLPAEIKETEPEVILLLGGVACSLIPGVRLDMHHGVPRRAELFGWSGWVVPMYHPAIGLHEGKWMAPLLEDWESLRDFFDTRDSDIDPRCENGYSPWDVRPPVNYRLWNGNGDFKQLIKSRPRPVAVDTERHGSEPFSVQVSWAPGRARMILANNKMALGRLEEVLLTSEVILHNAPEDIRTLSKLGIRVPNYRDTMQEAFQLANLPQALKTLAYRLFRVTMTSWEDVVRPASIDKLQEWLAEALVVAQADLNLVDIKKLKTKVREKVVAGPMEQLFTRLLRHTDVRSQYDPWERLREFWSDESNEWMTSHVEARVGKWPILGIGNCDISRAVVYGCGDADLTGQVAVELERRRGDASWQVAEEDRDQ